MPRLRSLWFLALAVLAFGWARPVAAQTTVTGMVAQSSAIVRQRLPITFTPLSTPQVVAPWLITSDTVAVRTDTNGAYCVALLRGNYGVRFGNVTNDSAVIQVESDSGTYHIADLFTSTNLIFQLTNIMVGATSTNAGLSGLVPAPAAGDQAKFLKGDGTWAAASGGGSTVTNLADIGDVVLTSPTANQALRYDGTNWVNATDTGGGNTFDQDNGTTWTFDAE